MLHHMLRAAAQRAFNVLDPYFQYVTMLLHGDGTNGAQNNTFLDSSTNNFTITRNGNTTQGTFTPYGSNWSNYFDGSSNLALSSAAVPATGAFTVECWVYITGTAASQSVYSQYASGDANRWMILWNDTANKFTFAVSGATSYNSTSTYSANTWYHIAWVRDGSNNLSFYINGVRDSTNAGVTTSLATVNPMIGNRGGGGTPYTGYISNLRITNTAVYSGTTYTIPTAPLTNISGTTLLTCQSNRFVDNETTAKTFTITGSPSVQRFSPFSPTTAYSTSVIGGSGYFDGSGDNLSIASNANLAIGSGQYTAEFWIYFNSVTTLGEFFECTTTGNTGCFTFYFNGTNALQVVATGGAGPTTVTWAPTTGQWYHMAATRDSSNNQRVFANGVLLGTATSTNNYGQNGFRLFSSTHNGYITDARLIVGSCLYTSAFTPPTAPLTAVSGTQMLMSCTNAGILDNAMMNDLETVGNAQISTSVKKYGTGSIAFDGTGDALYATSQATTFFTGNFTLEFWIYFNAVNNSTTKFVYDMRNSGATSASFLAQETDNSWTFWNGAGTQISTGFTGSTFSATTWTHVAICRSSGTTKFFVNGTQTNSVADTSSYANSTLVVGARYNYANELNAYIDDLRISKYARYTSNFTAPTAAFPNN